MKTKFITVNEQQNHVTQFVLMIELPKQAKQKVLWTSAICIKNYKCIWFGKSSLTFPIKFGNVEKPIETVALFFIHMKIVKDYSCKCGEYTSDKCFLEE